LEALTLMRFFVRTRNTIPTIGLLATVMSFALIFGCDSGATQTPEESAKAAQKQAETIKQAEDESKADMSKRGKKSAIVKFGKKPGMNPGGAGATE
jgi:hypothetical protein